MKAMQIRILPEFKDLDSSVYGEAFYSAFGVEVEDEKLHETISYVDSIKSKDMVRLRITFDEEQEKWLKIVTETYGFKNNTQALNACLKICENHPLFNASV